MSGNEQDQLVKIHNNDNDHIDEQEFQSKLSKLKNINDKLRDEINQKEYHLKCVSSLILLLLITTITVYYSDDTNQWHPTGGKSTVNNDAAAVAAADISCSVEPAMQVLAEQDEIKRRVGTEFYELMATRIKISFFDASAIKSDYIFHEYFKGTVAQRTNKLLWRASMSIPIIWLGYSIVDLTARKIMEVKYLNQFCDNTLEFKTFVGDDFGEVFAAYLMQFENNMALDEPIDMLLDTLVKDQMLQGGKSEEEINKDAVKDEVQKCKSDPSRMEKLFQERKEDMDDGELKNDEDTVKKRKKWPMTEKLSSVFSFFKADPTKKRIVAAKYWSQKYSDRILKIILKGTALKIWRSIIESNEYKGNKKRAEEVALYTLAALTHYHPKTINPFRLIRRGIEFMRDHPKYGAKGIMAVNDERQLKLYNAMNRKDVLIPEKTKTIVNEYVKTLRGKNANIEKDEQVPVMEIPDDEDDQNKEINPQNVNLAAEPYGENVEKKEGAIHPKKDKEEQDV